MKQLEQIEIGRYQIQSHLVRGGMADIYLAHDKESDQTVAIKMVHESAGDYCERFQREVKAMAGLVHEHILPAFDHGEYQSWYFLVTPYIEYGTLNGRLAAGPLTLEEVDPILAQLCEALQFAHEQGVIHRDIKPSNILMRDGNHVYLADFGLVKRVGQENGLTITGYLIGTPEYMAPELAEEDATPQSDVYALGVLLYQMLAGRVPFTANTPMGIFLRHIRDIPKPPTAYNASIPPAVEKVILRAIEKDPHERYQSAQELYLAYQEAVKSVVSVRASSTDQPIQSDQTVGAVDIKIVKQRGRTRKPLLIMALLALFCLIGVFTLASSVLSPGVMGSNTHTADAKGAKSTAIPTVEHVGPRSTMDSAASNRLDTGSTSVNAIRPVSTTSFDQGSGSSIQTQSMKDVSSPTNYGSGDGSGQGSNNAGNGGGGQTTGSGSGDNTGTGKGTGSGSGQGNGNGGSGQATGNGGSGQGNGNGGSGQGNGNGGSGQGNGEGNGKGNGNGKENGNGNGNSGKGNGNGKEKGKGNGNGNGGGNGKGNGGGNGKGNGNGNGKKK